jgi:hypothetical protein
MYTVFYQKQIKFLTDQLKIKDKQYNTLLSCMSNQAHGCNLSISYRKMCNKCEMCKCSNNLNQCKSA